MRRVAGAFVAAALAVGAVGCGSDDADAPPPDGPVVAALGDSITAGFPGFDPDPEIRDDLPGGGDDVTSQWGYWTERARPGVRVRNCGVAGERTDEIAARLDTCLDGAVALVVQGGTNDIGQGRSTASAAANLRGIVRRARARLGADRVLLGEVLPVDPGGPAIDASVADLNRRLRAVARGEGVTLVRWRAPVTDPADPGRFRPGLATDGLHPTVGGHRALGEVVAATLPDDL